MPWRKFMPEQDIFHETLNYLYREMKHVKISLSYAEQRKGVTLTELVNLQTKVNVIDGLIEMVLKSYNIEDAVEPVDNLESVEV